MVFVAADYMTAAQYLIAVLVVERVQIYITGDTHFDSIHSIYEGGFDDVKAVLDLASPSTMVNSPH